MIGDNLWEFPCKCGSMDRVFQKVVDEDRTLGRLPEHITVGALEIKVIPVVESNKKPKVGDEASVLTAFYDICEKCGREYCFKVVRDVKKFTVDMSHLVRPPGPGLPPNIFRGKG